MLNHETIKFSIIIPVYNAEKYLYECIESVLSQTYKNFELLLINDGSTDNSGNICDYYSKLDSRVKVIHQENQGRVLARREGIENAIGDYLLFLDSDDYWDVDLLESIFQCIREFNCDMIIFKYKRVRNGVVVEEQPQIFEHRKVFVNEDKDVIFKKIISTSNLNNLVTKVIKRSIVDRSDYFPYKDIRNAEDLLQSLPWIYNAKTIVYLNKPYYNYRINPNSTTKIFDINRINDISIVRSILLNYLKRLRLDTNENVYLFYKFYLNIFISYIIDLVNSNEPKKQIFNKLHQLKNNELYLSSLKYIESKDIAIHKRILIFFYNKQYFDLLFVYTKLLKKLKVFYDLFNS